MLTLNKSATLWTSSTLTELYQSKNKIYQHIVELCWWD